MATLPLPRGRRFSDFPEPATKTDVSEYFSPDILRVFMDDRDGDVPPVFFSSSRPSRAAVVHDDAAATPTGISTTPSSSFPQFRFLPPELRWMIWEAALPEPTVVPRTWNNRQFRYILQRKVPSVLQACSEARGLLVAKCQTTLPSTSAPRLQLVKPRGRADEGMYMNWRTDSVWIYRGCKSCLSRVGGDQVSISWLTHFPDDIGEVEVAAYANMERLVMNWGLRPCWLDSIVNEGVKFIQQFPKLGLLTLLVDFSEHGWPEPSTLKGLKRLKRNEVKRIWGLVQKAFAEAKKNDSTWSPPALHIVHRTANWSRQEAK